MTPNNPTVHMIFKTHLDVGFTDYAHRVVERYFRHFIPNAISLAKTLRDSDEASFVWTTGSWLIYEYLEQASAEERRLMEDAIIAGEITWHGLPFTTHTELMDTSLFRYGLRLAKILDERFGKQTIAAKMTDVPGHTRGMVPLLAEAGITFLHIGVNPASTVPDVPPVFIWRDEPSGADIVVMYHHEYGNTSTIPGLDDAISVILTGDNIGPQSPEDVREAFNMMRQRFPQANIIASTLDAFASKLPAIRANLPILTSEIGDTWIHGVGTDPAKVGGFRELSRLRKSWIEESIVNEDAPDVARFSQNLLLIAEHTWGMDEKTHLPEHGCYDRSDFHKARQREDFRRFEASWTEQRRYLTEAVDALIDPELKRQATARLDALIPSRPRLEYGEACRLDTNYETPHFTIRFDQTGALTRLTCRENDYEWAGDNKRLGTLIYQTFSHEDYDRFWNQFIRNRDKLEVTSWAIEDYTKPGLEHVQSHSRNWTPTVDGIQRRVDENGHHFLAHLHMPREAVDNYGCPRVLTLMLYFPQDAPNVHFDLRWFNKTASRKPEALWFSFNPAVDTPDRWMMDKLGGLISPLEVVSKGARNLHAVDTGVVHQGIQKTLYIDTIDAPLVAPGKPALLQFDDSQPPLENGVNFNLYNNIWGTNFPMWYEDDARFRFVLRMEC